MSIEMPHLDLTQAQRFSPALIESKETRANLVKVTASIETLAETREALCSLRAEGVSALLLLRRPQEPLSDDDLIQVCTFLAGWDQLLLANIIELCPERFPEAVLPHLEFESRTEVKWFQEWQTAVSDPRIHRYPGLPWRSFLRKVNAENLAFIEALIEEKDDSVALSSHFQAFLQAKKKTICIFPKNWGKK